MTDPTARQEKAIDDLRAKLVPSRATEAGTQRREALGPQAGRPLRNVTDSKLRDCLDEVRARFLRPPFQCMLLTCFRRGDTGELSELNGALPPEVEAERDRVETAVRLGGLLSLEIRGAPEGQRWTVGVLPIPRYSFVFLKCDAREADPMRLTYGITTDTLDVMWLSLVDLLLRLCRHRGLEDFELEDAAYHSMFSSLLRDHEGEFVAIYQGDLIDHDVDEFALARRVLRQHRGEFVLIREVTQWERPVAHFISPEREVR